jgi:hypothetical protein
MLPLVLWASSHSPAAATFGEMTLLLGVSAPLRFSAAWEPTTTIARVAARTATVSERRDAVASRVLGERKTVTNESVARMASGMPRSRSKRCGKPLKEVRLPANSSTAHRSRVRCASACCLPTRPRKRSLVTRSAPSIPNHSTGCEVVSMRCPRLSGSWEPIAIVTALPPAPVFELPTRPDTRRGKS